MEPHDELFPETRATAKSTTARAPRFMCRTSPRTHAHVSVDWEHRIADTVGFGALWKRGGPSRKDRGSDLRPNPNPKI